MARSGLFLQAAFLCFVLLCSGRANALIAFNEYPIPGAGNNYYGITGGPSNDIWFTEYSVNKIGRMTTGGVLIAEYDIPMLNSAPAGITLGPDNNIWFTESATTKVGKITTGGVFSEYPVSNLGGWDITTGPDNNLWFTHYGAIGSTTTLGSGGPIYGSPPFGINPRGIATGSDGAAWFTYDGSIGRLATDGTYTSFGIPVFDPGWGAIAAGPDGALWFTLNKHNTIGKITTSGVVTLFNCPTPDPAVNWNSITSGPDGAIWFTQSNINKIGRITTFGSMTEYPLPTADSSPGAITAGPDGAIWFTEGFGRNKIGRLSFSKYLIKTTSGGNGTVTCNPNPVMESTVSLCSISPSSHYHVYDVSAGDFGSSIPSIGPTSYYYFNNVNVDKDIQAGFELNDIRLYHGASLSMSYFTIQEALNEASLLSDGDWVKVLPGAYVEGTGLTVNRADAIPLTFTLSGGWNYAFDAYALSGTMTTIAGSLTIEGTGGLIIDRIAIQ